VITAALRLADVGQRVRWFGQEVATPTRDWTNLCLMLARLGAGVTAATRGAVIYPQADVAFTHTRYRSEPLEAPPAGWLVWYDRGQVAKAAVDSDAGHVITSAGNGLGWSNDVRVRGRVHLVKLSEPVTKWGYRRVGDSRDLDGVLVVPKDTRVPKGHPPVDSPQPAGHLYTVHARDTISGLVDEHGPHGLDWRDVWRDPHNAALRKLRGRPELIRPGDHVWVP
jgi:hypothetical protein